MSAVEQTITLGREFWTMLFFGLVVPTTPLVRLWLLTKFPSSTVNLFTASLPFVPIGTYCAGVGAVHLLYTPLLVLASWKASVAIMALIDAVTRCVDAVCQSVERMVTSAIDAVCCAVVTCFWNVLAFRKTIAVAVVATALKYPTFGLLVVLGMVVGAIVEVVMAIVDFVRWINDLARAADAAARSAANKAADCATRGVEAAVDAITNWMVSAFWKILTFRKCLAVLVAAASLASPAFAELAMFVLAYSILTLAMLAGVYLIQCVFDLACALVRGVKHLANGTVRGVVAACAAAANAVVAAFWSILAFRKCMAAFVVTASLAFPPLGFLVGFGIIVWAFVELVVALVHLVEYGINAACAAAVAVKQGVIHAVHCVGAAISAAMDAMVAALWSMLGALFRGFMSVLVWTLTLAVKVLAYCLKTAAIMHFMVNPCPETFALALAIKVAIALLKYAVLED